ncbi:MAG: DUF4956 domain-containing protein [Lachnospiraceae bacterium]|nr:DUF4956 domain-containing protein [Lachnospiraceae bacterium]
MKEVLYNSLSNATNGLTITDVIVNFLAAAVIACLIYISYRISHSGPVYSERFNVSIVMLTLVTTLVMNVIGNNIALSLGMVGALSIVRFRTAIKDPRDTAYIFWGIAVGICCGVSDYLIAAIGSALIFAFLILFGFIRDNGRIMVIVNCEPAAGEEVEKHMGNLFGGKAALRVHNRAVKTQTEEFIYEISDNLLKKSEKRNGKLVKNLSGIEGVSSVSMVRQDDEINQ